MSSMSKDENKHELAEEAATYDTAESSMQATEVSTESKDAITRIVNSHRAALVRLADR